MKRRLCKIMFGLMIFICGLGGGVYAYLQLPKFGQLPKAESFELFMRSPHYANGQFENLEPIPRATDQKGFVFNFINYIFAEKNRPTPPVPVPIVKTDLFNLDRNKDVVIWLGHSSYFIQLSGQRILLDPVLSSNASPVPFTNEAFEGTSFYTADDIPAIDYMLITHDHWDHLDYPTVMVLKNKIENVITPLGVGSHLKRWGVAENKIREANWYDQLQLGGDLTIHVLPARHYSGRTLIRNKTLWAAFALMTSQHKIYVSGDSGYGSHFLEAGKAFNGFDLAILDSGQYDEKWRYVHMMPEDVVKASRDLQTQALLPAHVGKFSIAYHSWDDPFIRVAKASQGAPYRLLTPKMGEPIDLNDKQQLFSFWWEEVVAQK